MMEVFDYEELVKATESFSPTRLIGKGSHGSVYKGILKGNKLVAIKKPTHSHSHEVILHDNSKLDNEIHVLSALRESENPHVINLLGAGHDSADNKLLVMELMHNGSLHDFLHGTSTTPPPPTWPKRVEIAIEIGRAVRFLHEGKPSVIHRDIKSANILFDSNWKAKLADFGLAVLRVDSPSQVSQPAGTIGYLDPCYTVPSKLSTKNDVYSFGIVLLEIISGTKAIDICRAPASIVEWAIPLIEKQQMLKICDTRVALPTHMEATIRHILSIAARCVSSKEAYRPSIGEITTQIEMESCFVNQPVRFSLWMSRLQSVILRRRRQKLGGRRWQEKCATQQGGDLLHSNASSRKMLLKEVLADMTLK